MDNIISLFVVGLPRSGTKLLRNLLNNHDQIFIPSIEAYFIPHLISKYGDKQLNDREIDQVLKEIRSSLFFFYYNKKRKESFNFAKHATQNITVKELIGSIWQELAINKIGRPAPILGDKTPRNVKHVQLLLDSFPESKIIHIVRDPRDNVLSAKKTWGKNMYRAAYKWQKGINQIGEVKRGRERLIEVTYEQLLQNTGTILKQLCNFIGLDYRNGMDELQIKVENKGGEVDKTNFNKYQRELKHSEVEYIERLTKKGLQKYGYLLENEDVEFISRPAPYKLLRWKFQDNISLLVYNIQEHGLLKGIEKIRKARKHT